MILQSQCRISIHRTRTKSGHAIEYPSKLTESNPWNSWQYLCNAGFSAFDFDLGGEVLEEVDFAGGDKCSEFDVLNLGCSFCACASRSCTNGRWTLVSEFPCSLIDHASGMNSLCFNVCIDFKVKSLQGSL